MKTSSGLQEVKQAALRLTASDKADLLSALTQMRDSRTYLPGSEQGIRDAVELLVSTPVYQSAELAHAKRLGAELPEDDLKAFIAQSQERRR